MASLMPFGEYVRLRRIALGMHSQAKFATKVGVNKSTISRLERGITSSRNAGNVIISRLADLLQIDIMQFLEAAQQGTADTNLLPIESVTKRHIGIEDITPQMLEALAVVGIHCLEALAILVQASRFFSFPLSQLTMEALLTDYKVAHAQE